LIIDVDHHNYVRLIYDRKLRDYCKYYIAVNTAVVDVFITAHLAIINQSRRVDKDMSYVRVNLEIHLNALYENSALNVYRIC